MRASDRLQAIPPGCRVVSDYVHVDSIRKALPDKTLGIGDVEAKYRHRLEILPAQPWPGPFGQWNEAGDVFTVDDGHHDFAAAFLLGTEHVLVSWIEAP